MNFSYVLFKYKAFYKEDGFRWFFEKGNMTWNTDKKLTIKCQEGNLVCRVYDGKRVADSSIVYRTTGVLDVFGQKWEGKAGVIDWQKVKFDKEKTYAKIRGYRCDLKSAQVKVDTVELITPYFKTPILGKLADKTILEMNEGESSPQFVSFEKRLKIPDLRENLDYDGGFTLEGADFIGKGTEEKPAKIILKRDNKRLIEVASVDFQMDPAKIIARKSSVKMFYANGDSLYIKEAFLFLDENKKNSSGFAIPIGIYIVDAYARFTPSSSAVHTLRLGINTISGALTSLNYTIINILVASNAITSINYTYYLSVATPTTYFFVFNTTLAGNLNGTFQGRFLRIA
jgi:hypothetical protein